MSDHIRTERLLLRPWRDADREPFAAMGVDPEVMRYFPAPLNHEASDALIDRQIAAFEHRGYGLWAVERLDSGQFIGFTGLAPMPAGVPGEGGMEIGWRLAAEHWGQGFATEAARAVLAFAFDTAGLDEVFSMTAVLNEPSQRVMQRIGMRHIDDFEHPRLDSASPLRPHVLYRITEQEFRAGAAPTTDPDFTVRSTTEHDWREIRAIRLEMIRDTPIAYLESLAAAESQVESEWRMRGRRGETAIGMSLAAIDRSGRWIGAAGGYLPSPSTPLLVGVYVAPDVRGSGVLDALLAPIEAWAATHGSALTLSVHEHNLRARAAYLKRGFALTGATEPYPLDPSQRELIMVKQL